LEGVKDLERKLLKDIRNNCDMNSDDLQNKHAQEVHGELAKHNIIPEDSKLISYKQLQGGADTKIFEIIFHDLTTKYIQRVFRSGASNKAAEFEYSVQKILYENGIKAPKPFLLKPTPNSRERPYFIMEKIEGTPFEQVLDNNPEQFSQLIYKFLQELHKIHTIDQKLFPQIPSPDFQKNPFAPIDQILKHRRLIIEKYPEELNELKPVFEWLENNKTNNPCKKAVVIHGDYHQANIIVQENQEYRILDWTGININDFRMDLGFSAVTIGCFPKYEKIVGSKKKLTQMIVNTYEQISGSKVENLPYFMILTNTYNLLRLYSIINNPTITNENEQSKNFFKVISEYPLYLAELVKETSNIRLNQIEEYFELKD
jgi:aminoglycoside phosphotransferase (APT) family kinase protein